MQSILLRKGASTTEGVRHILKYSYWRTVPPQRDWVVEDDFDPHAADYGGHGVARYVAHMFYRLCGRGPAGVRRPAQAAPGLSTTLYASGRSSMFMPSATASSGR